MKCSMFQQELPGMSLTGGPKLSAAETLQVGSYNALLATSSVNGDDATYQASKETFESSHDIFRTAFPGGFAWEVQAVYSPPPVVVMKFRHWGVMEGPFKGHAPTGAVVDSIGICVAKVCPTALNTDRLPHLRSHELPLTNSFAL